MNPNSPSPSRKKKFSSILSSENLYLKHSLKSQKKHGEKSLNPATITLANQLHNPTSTSFYPNKIFKLNCLQYDDFPDRISSFEEKDCDFTTLLKIRKETKICKMKDPQYSREVFQFLRYCELLKQPVKENIKQNHNRFNQSMRNKLVNWMVSVSIQFNLRNETLLLSIGYVDRFLCKICNRDFQSSNLQLMGVVSILIASKIEELIPPRIDDLLFVTEYSHRKEEILVMEWLILDSLSYETIQPTIITFLTRILRGNNLLVRSSEETTLKFFCSYLAELAICDYKVVSLYLPSLIASSCVLLANFILFIDRPIWTSELQRLSGNYRPSQLENCSIQIYKKLYDSICNLSNTSSINKKYSNSKFWESSIHREVTRSLNMFKSPPSFIFADLM